MPAEVDNRSFDGTLRIAFALYGKPKLKERTSAESLLASPDGGTSVNAAYRREEPCRAKVGDLCVEWLGGYWKLPKSDSTCPVLRERVISLARSGGTAPVKSEHLAEVYAALGDCLQRLFSEPEPTGQILRKRYETDMELATFLTIRLGVKSANDAERALLLLKESAESALQLPRGPARRRVESFINRGLGVFEARAGAWPRAVPHLQRSLVMFPTNANSLHLLGMAALFAGKPAEAADLLNRSLLLDPDGRAPYVNLGVAYLRLQKWSHALDISEAGLSRHPTAVQCQYHVMVSCCQQALRLEAREHRGVVLKPEEVDEYEMLQLRGLEALHEARASDEAKVRRRGETDGVGEAPWQEVDDKMSDAMQTPTDELRRIELPPNIGWPYFTWRL